MAAKKEPLEWKLITDRGHWNKVTVKRLAAQLKRLENREIEFLILEPSRAVGGTSCLQAAWEFDPAEGMSYALEFGSTMKDGKNIFLRNYPVPQAQLEKVFEEYLTGQAVPDCSGWLYVNIFRPVPLVKCGQLHWDFPSRTFQDTHAFTEAVNAYDCRNRENWHPDFTAVAYSVIYLSFQFCEKEEPPLQKNEKLLKKKKIPGSDYSLFSVKARIQAENQTFFTEGELLKAVHNQLAGRFTGIWKDTFILQRDDAETDGPLFSLYRGSFGRRAMVIASNGENSLYQKIHQELEKNQTLSADFTLRPRGEHDKISFVDGFPDGVWFHHIRNAAKASAPLKKTIRLASSGNGVAAENCLKAFFAAPDQILLPYADALSVWLYRNQDELDTENLLAFAWNLLERSGEIECVKTALLLTELINHPWREEDKQMLRELGQADEFTFYVLMNMEQWENREEEIFHLAQKVHGWGRIFAVHHLQPATEEIKAWLLHEGIDNTILPEYSSLETAQKINLTEVVKNSTPDSTDLLDAGKIITSMIKGGPTLDISAYDGKKELLRSFLEKAAKARPGGGLYQIVFTIELYAENTHRKKILQQAKDILQSAACLDYLRQQLKKGKYVFLAAMEGLDAARGVKIAFRRDWEANANLLHLLHKPEDIQEMVDFFVEKSASQDKPPAVTPFPGLETMTYRTILQVIEESQVDIDEEKLLRFGLSRPGKIWQELTRDHIRNMQKQGLLQGYGTEKTGSL